MIVDLQIDDLFRQPTPQTAKQLFERVRQIVDAGWMQMPATARYNGTGGPGNFLEDLMGLRAGNQDIADILGWEVKYFTKKTHLITLFHKEPQPEGILRQMLSTHGWQDSEGRMSFRHTIAGKSDRFVVDDRGGNLIVRALSGGNGPSWSHDTLLNVAGGKLRRLLLVEGEKDGPRVRYLGADAFENMHLTLLVAEICAGTICIDFDVREQSAGSNGLRNHGTKFRVAPDRICRLYMKKDHLGRTR